MAQFQVVIKKGPEPGKIFLLSNNEITLGRDVGNEIALNDAEISRNHCRFTYQGSGYAIEDLGSTNGTTVNNQNLAAAQMLRGGDKIQCGDNVVLEFQVVGAEVDATIISHGGLPDPAKPQPLVSPPPIATPPVKTPPEQAPLMKASLPVASPQAIESNQPVAPNTPKKGISRQLLLGCGAIILIGGCIAIATLWYIDSNSLWCDVFGNTVCQGLATMVGQ